MMKEKWLYKPLIIFGVHQYGEYIYILDVLDDCQQWQNKPEGREGVPRPLIRYVDV